MPVSEPAFRSQLIRIIVATALAIVLFAVRWFPQPDPDTGLNLTAGWQITQGLVPYWDFFEFHTPGAFYLLAGVFWLFGPSYVAAKLVSVLLVLATAVILDRLCLRFTRSGWHRLAVQMVWITLQMQFPLISYNNYSQLASMWAAYALVSAWQKRMWQWFVTSGIAVAAVTWLLQTRGLAVLLVGLGVALAVHQWRLLAAYVGAVGAGLLPFLAWPLPVLWQNFVVYPLAYYPAANVVNPKWLFLSVGIELACAGAALIFRVRRAGFWPLWWMSVALLLTTWARADLVYLPMVLWPVPILLAAIAVAQQHGRGPMRLPKAVRGCWYFFQAGLGMAATSLLMLSLAVFGLARWLDFSDDPFGLQVPYWERMAKAVQARTKPAEPIFATPSLMSLYFFSQRPNATRFNWLLTSTFPEPYFLAAVADLERAKPKIVVRDFNSLAVQLGFHRDGTIVDQYLDAHYRMVERLPGVAGSSVQILERLPNTP